MNRVCQLGMIAVFVFFASSENDTCGQTAADPLLRGRYGQQPAPTSPNENQAAFTRREPAPVYTGSAVPVSRTEEPRKLTKPNRTGTSAGRRSSTTSTTPSPLTSFFALAFVVTLIVVGGRILRKHGPMAHTGIPIDAIEVLGRRNLDQRQVIHLVRCGSRILVIGASASGLQTLCEVNDPVEVDFLAGLCRQSSPEPKVADAFRQLFGRATATRGKAPGKSASGKVIGGIDAGRDPRSVDELARELEAAHG